MIAEMERWLGSARQAAADLLGESTGTDRWAAPAHPNGGYVLNLDGDNVVGQFIVWPNGSFEAELIDAESGEQRYQAQGTAEDGVAALSAMTRAIEACLAIEREPSDVGPR